jgi:hypothetical protein
VGPPLPPGLTVALALSTCMSAGSIIDRQKAMPDIVFCLHLLTHAEAMC